MINCGRLRSVDALRIPTLETPQITSRIYKRRKRQEVETASDSLEQASMVSRGCSHDRRAQQRRFQQPVSHHER